MKNGHRDRLRQLKARDTAAAAIGHALLDTTTEFQHKICDSLLQHLLEGPSRTDLLSAINALNIPVDKKYEPELVRLADLESERVRRGRESRAKGLDRKVVLEEFERKYSKKILSEREENGSR